MYGPSTEACNKTAKANQVYQILAFSYVCLQALGRSTGQVSLPFISLRRYFCSLAKTLTISHFQMPYAFLLYFYFPNRCHSSSKLDSSSYEERKISKQFEDLTLDELEVIATLGMGGFGRVELVINFPHA